MNKIYLVSAGDYSDYSDYRIIAFFSTKEKAQEFMETFKEQYNEIEEFNLDSDYVDKIKNGYSIWHVRMKRNGDVEKISLLENTVVSIENMFCLITNGKEFLVYDVFAKSEEHAIKIANEKRIMMIANGEWSES